MTLNDIDGRAEALYVGVVDTGVLTGPEAVRAAVNMLFDGRHSRPLANTTTHVDLRLTAHGISLTDKLRRCSEP